MTPVRMLNIQLMQKAKRQIFKNIDTDSLTDV